MVDAENAENRPPGSDCRFESHEFSIPAARHQALAILERRRPARTASTTPRISRRRCPSCFQGSPQDCSSQASTTMPAPSAVGLLPQSPRNRAFPRGRRRRAVRDPDGRCTVLENEQLHYPVSELAARYGASVEEETSDFNQVYVRFAPSRRSVPRTGTASLGRNDTAPRSGDIPARWPRGAPWCIRLLVSSANRRRVRSEPGWPRPPGRCHRGENSCLGAGAGARNGRWRRHSRWR